MYSYLKGTLVEVEGDKAVIEVNGVGFLVHVGAHFHLKAPQIQNQLFIYTHLVVREDSFNLFGFLTRSERDLFLDVQTVSGVGPKLALAITSHINVSDFAQAILGNDTNTLSKIPGIGKKSAERLVMELKDKVSKYSFSTQSIPAKVQLIEEAIAALVALGLPKHQASQAVNKSIQARPDVSDVSLLLQLALSQKRIPV